MNRARLSISEKELLTNPKIYPKTASSWSIFEKNSEESDSI